MGLEKLVAKPTGLAGRIAGKLMNLTQTGVYRGFLQNFLHENDTVLDMGCGGGKFINYLYRNSHSSTLYGLDHSEEMIKLARKVNRKGVETGRVKFITSSADDIPLEENVANVVTAFETVQFWTETEKSFNEVRRVLKDGGKFIIINRYPEKGSKWWKFAKIKSDEEYRKILKNAGFNKVSTDLNYKKGWIFVKAS